jgi:dipeptidase E
MSHGVAFVYLQNRQSTCAAAATISATFFLLVAVSLGAGVSQAPAQAEKGQSPAKRQILAIGGGGLEKSEGPPLLMKYFLGLTGKPKPRVCFMPSASCDAVAEITRWNQVMKGLDCEPRVQKVYIASPKVPSPKAKKFEDELLEADAIYIGGGNALNMLAIWQAHGIDKMLRQAYDRGIVLGGEGAGSVCWFEQALTDSRPGKLTPLDCLGFLKGSNCTDCDVDKSRQPLFQDCIKKGEIKEGYATDRGIGLHFVDDKLYKVVSANANAHAYHVTREGAEELAIPELLAK